MQWPGNGVMLMHLPKILWQPFPATFAVIKCWWGGSWWEWACRREEDSFPGWLKKERSDHLCCVRGSNCSENWLPHSCFQFFLLFLLLFTGLAKQPLKWYIQFHECGEICSVQLHTLDLQFVDPPPFSFKCLYFSENLDGGGALPWVLQKNVFCVHLALFFQPINSQGGQVLLM